MTEKQTIRNQAIAIASMTPTEMKQHAQKVSMSELSDKVKKDIYRLIDKALGILQEDNIDVMAVSSNIKEAS